MQETRTSLVEFMAQHPDVFWAFVYAAWGGIYAAITISIGVMAFFSAKWTKAKPEKRGILFAAQLVWAVVHLGAVFVVPWLLGTYATDVIRESRLLPLMLAVWAVGVGSMYFLARPFLKIPDIFGVKK